MDIQTILQVGQTVLCDGQPAALPQVRLEAEVLLAHTLGVSREYLYTRPLQSIKGSEKRQFEDLITRRFQGEPIAYLIGCKEFWSLPLMVSNEVLIPRPETELLVEQALECLSKDRQGIRVLDLGTGSGAIALALAVERPDWQIVAVDKKEAALNIARKNAKNLAVTNVEFYQSDWFNYFGDDHLHFDIIVSNPPYIASYDVHLERGDCRYEPKEALIAGEKGLQELKFIIFHAINYLAPKGWLILEHGFDQALALKDWMQFCHFKEVKSFQDLAGLDRVVMGHQ